MKRDGFTLIEVMVALAIVSSFIVGLVLSLNRASQTQAQVRNLKIARGLGRYTLSQIEAGLYWDEIDDTIGGTYADLGYPEFSFEVAIGDDNFEIDNENDDRYDPWAETDDADDEDEEDEIEEPYEKIRIRVTFFKLAEYKNELEMELWVPWDQVYGPDEDGDGDSGESSP